MVPHAANSDPLEGTPYRAIAPLGSGAMGDTFKAEHRTLLHIVAAKKIKASLARDDVTRDRMRIEAQAMARIVHPNLVRVVDFGTTADGALYYAMELLKGRTLSEELHRRVALPWREASHVVLDVLAALEAVHEHGLVHRDVKLDNIFYCEGADGHRVVKLLDLGIAKVVGTGGANKTAVQPLMKGTAPGLVLGTPKFMSPEQIGGTVDLRTDVYAAGLVFYQLLAGRGPFDDSPTLANLLLAQMAKVPDLPSEHSPQDMPDEIDRVVMRSLEKDPEDRFQTAPQFGTDIRAVLDRHSVDETPSPAKSPTVRAAVVEGQAVTTPLPRTKLKD